MIFPWIEEAETELTERIAKHDCVAHDYALTHFLELLKWFCCILIQDLAIIYNDHPNIHLF